jgi:cysteine desulfurase
MQIYLDANATTPVLPQARRAAIAAMEDDFGNPSSVHSAGLRARALLDGARATARRVIGAPTGRLLFTSGATEGIQTAVLSAFTELRRRRDAGERVPGVVLYGATEHKAVPEALQHWNSLLGLELEILAIPVGTDGRHDLAWLHGRAPLAALVCTMAANNETGVVSDLEGIAQAIGGSSALWLVDGVQALGKLSLELARRRIDYAPFSGHKLYAPKGIGMLYVREGAPFTPLIAGGGQEAGLRSGTENMAGIAALGAVLDAYEAGGVFADHHQLEMRRDRLVSALRDAFPGMVFNAPLHICLPTTLNFSVPGVGAKQLLDLFDAAGIRVSGGSACSASKAAPSFVLEAMRLPPWQCASAVRLSFGGADSHETIDEACRRIRACGESMRDTCQLPMALSDNPAPTQALTRFVVDGACCYIVADDASKCCLVVDPLPELTPTLARWIRCRRFSLRAVLDTHNHADHHSSAGELLRAVGEAVDPDYARGERDGLGWPLAAPEVRVGPYRLTRLPVPGHTQDSTAYLLHEGEHLRAVFTGDTVMPGALGRSDFPQSEPLRFGASLKALQVAAGLDTLLLPAHDYEDRFATTLRIEAAAQPLLAAALQGTLSPEAFASSKAQLEQQLTDAACQTVVCGARVDSSAGQQVEVSPGALAEALRADPRPVLVDVREDYETRVTPSFQLEARRIPVSALINELPSLASLPAHAPVVFLCRSGNRSAQAARALRRMGHAQSWSLAGGLAMWPGAPVQDRAPAVASV